MPSIGPDRRLRAFKVGHLRSKRQVGQPGPLCGVLPVTRCSSVVEHLYRMQGDRGSESHRRLWQAGLNDLLVSVTIGSQAGSQPAEDSVRDSAKATEPASVWSLYFERG